MFSIKDLLINHLTFLGKYKRLFVAFKDAYSKTRISYSQHKEDIFILDVLKQFNLYESIYVDIGANHPSDISNTYLLYRNGYKGILIEPNEELCNLLRRFRKKDIVIPIGCSDKSSVLKFNISKTPVISSFTNHNLSYRSTYVPVMKIDDVLSELDYKIISILSIDVEGLNLEVLKGASKTIKNSLLICVEFDHEYEKNQIQNILGVDFELLATFGCNLIFINKLLKNSYK
jgi:FkbM family methyltransferase